MPSNSRRGGSSQTSTQGSTIQGDDEQRFAELLRPIKDLTANWNIPLAEYLENYYEELTELHIDIDGHTAKVNFAEAALLLQGTASVYSKKVEFLWQAVLNMLDLLASKKAFDEASAGGDNAGGPGGRKTKKGFILDPSSFSSISIELAKNVDMKPEILGTAQVKGTSNSVGTPDHHQRKMTLKFIFVTPRQLIERGTEGKEMKEVRVNLYVPPAGNSASSTKYDLIGHKEDFRVNMQFALGTAMIGEELSHQSDLGQQSVSLCEDDSILDDTMSVSLYEGCHNSIQETSFNQHDPHSKEVPTDPDPGGSTTSGSPSTQSNAQSSQGDKATSEAVDSASNGTATPSTDSQSVASNSEYSADQDCRSDDNMDEIVLDNENNNQEFEIANNQDKESKSPGSQERTKANERETRSKTTPLKKTQESEPKAPLADPWAPVTPHEAANTIPKPIRRGRIRRAPTRNVALSGTKSRPKKQINVEDEKPVIVPVKDFMIQQLSGGKYSLNGLRVGNKEIGMAAELQDMADNVERQKKRKAALENRNNNNIEKAIDLEDFLPSEGSQDADGNVEEDNHGWADENLDNPYEEDFANEPMPDPHEGGVAALVPEGVRGALVDNRSASAKGVGENATGDGVDSYEELVMKRVAAYVAQSQDYIESTDLAKRVAKWHDSIGPRLDAVEKRGNFDIHQYGSRILEHFPEGNAKTAISFAEIARGKEREEVARYFLSSLMLANTYNIELKNAVDEPLVMDQVEMTLLSTRRHHENMFQEIQEGEHEHHKTPKRKGTKRISSVNRNNSVLSLTSDEEDRSKSLSSSSPEVNLNRKVGKTKPNRWNRKTMPKTLPINGELHPIPEESSSQYGSTGQSNSHDNTSSPVPSSKRLKRLQDGPNSLPLEGLVNSDSARDFVPNISETKKNGVINKLDNATFKVPVHGPRDTKPGKRRKIMR